MRIDSLELENAQESLEHFEAAQHYPDNLCEGKHLLTHENHLHYFAAFAHEELDEQKEAKLSFEKAAQTNSNHSPTAYCQALILRKLGNEKMALKTLRELLRFATQQGAAEVKIDCFATSLPDSLLFEDDLQKRNRIDCIFLSALAHSGMGQETEAKGKFRRVLELDMNHLGARLELRRLASSEKNLR